MKDQSLSQKPHILIVDDEEFNRLLLLRILERDYHIDMAVNGQDALNKIAQHDYDAVLMDIMMPILNGIETLKIIRQELDFTTLPIILVSAISENSAIVEGMELGANDYITKPIDPRIVNVRLSTQIRLKQLTDERKMMTAALAESNDLKLRMMQIASHDLKNPLNNLSLLLGVMEEMVGDTPNMPNIMNIASQSIDTMVEIIDDFLGTKQGITSNFDIHITDLFANQLLDNVLSQYSVAADQKQIDLRTDIIADSLIAADGARITQVIGNLMSNAIKYTPIGGAVLIKTCVRHGVWRLEVHDTGSGIPADERQYLFQAFSKNHISTQPTNGESSTGLGLWIAAEMMAAQAARIGMVDSPLGGACFWIEVPLIDNRVTISA